MSGSPHVFTSMPLIKSVMTPFPYTIEVDASLVAAQAMMRDHGVRHLPVTRGGRLVGLLSERDLRRLLDPGQEWPAGDSVAVGDAALFDPFVVGMSSPLDDVLLEMAERRIGSALVVKDGRIAGIFTATDACRVLAEQLRALFPKGDGDAA